MSIKPTEKLGWIPDNSTNINDPGSLKTNGFQGGIDFVVANYNNWLFNRTSQWIEYVDRSEKLDLYVDASSGSDTTGDGTSGSPFATIERAMLETTAHIQNYYSIYLSDETHYITSNINITGKYVAIGGTGSSCKIVFYSYNPITPNRYFLRGFSLYQSFLYIYCDIELSKRASTTDDWATGAAPFLLYRGSGVKIHGNAEMNSGETASTTSPSVFWFGDSGTAAMIDGDWTSNSLAYLAGGRVGADLAISGTIDANSYIKQQGQSEVAAEFTTGGNSGAISNSGSTIQLRLWGSNISSASSLVTISDAESDSSIGTKLTTLFNTMFPGNPYTVTATAGRIAGQITGITIYVTITGMEDDGWILPAATLTYIGDNYEGMFRPIKKYRPANYNIRFYEV